eukprot:PhF_6_TR32698/c0_g1_i1/m.48268
MKKVFDLTQVIQEGHPVWPGRIPICREVVTTVEKDGYGKQNYTLGCDCCTHMDSPAHFIAGAASISDIQIDQLIVPLAVIDVADKCSQNPEYTLQIADIREWEERNKTIIPSRACVCMRSGWGQRFATDPIAYVNGMKFPGLSNECATFLVKERDVAGIGIDTLSTDVGTSATFPVHYTVLGAGRYQLENLNLEGVPLSGCMVSVGPMKILNAPEAPARVFAFS